MQSFPKYPDTPDRRPNPSEPLHSVGGSSTAVDRIEEQIGHRPNQIAISGDTSCSTYSDVRTVSDSTAWWLSSHGLLPGQIVAVHSGRNADLIPILLGVWKAGLAFVVVDSAYPQSSILERLRISQASAWIDVETLEISAVAEYLKTEGLACCSAASLKRTAPPFPSRARPEDLAYVAFTSGSTGTPRGVLGTHLPLAHFVNWQIHEFGLQPEDKFAMLSGISHDPLLRDFLTPMSLGATVHVPPDHALGDPRAFATWMLEQRISVAHITPTRLQILLMGAELLGRPLASLRYLFCGGEPMPAKLAAACRLAAPNIEIVNFYGATETPQAMGYHRGGNVETPGNASAIPLGRGIEGVQLLVVDDGGALADIQQEGEIWIRTPYLSKGYLNDSAATRERFVVNPFTGLPHDVIYKTGDLGVFLPDGQVEFRRRKDRQLKVRGHRLEPAGIEAAMESHPAVQSAIVIPIGGPDGVESAGCFVAKQGGTVPVAEMKRYLVSLLPPGQIPTRLLELESFPVTANGKLDRAAIEARLKRQGCQCSEQDLSQSERWLSSLWTRVLGLEEIGVDDNFFDLGGTSLAAARIVAEVERSVSLKVPLALLVECPSIRSFAARLDSGDFDSSWSPLVLLNRGDVAATPLFLVHAIGGNVVGYRELAQQLGSRPVYALQSPALSGRPTPDLTIEQMASRYIREIRTVRAQGPYHLGGFSAGGLVAFEMARQLGAAGEQVPSVCLLDTQDPFRSPLITTVATKLRKNIRMLPGLSFSQWRDFVATKLVNLRMNLLVFSNRLGKGRPVGESADQAEVQFRNARERFQPKVYDGCAVLFQTTLEDEAILERTVAQWTSLVPRNLDVRQVPGLHETILSKPNVEILAAHISEILNLSHGAPRYASGRDEARGSIARVAITSKSL